MSATPLNLPAAAVPSTAFGRTLRITASEIRYEVLRALRTRAFSLSVIGFPVMFYCLFGLLMNRNETIGHVAVAKYLLGGYAVFGSLGAAIFGIGAGVASDRAAGWLDLKQASPMPAFAYLLAKCCMAVVFSCMIVCILTVLGLTVGHVQISLAEFFRIAGLAALGSIPFSCLGLAMAFTVPPASAGGISNMIYLPMSFLSGLWVPLQFLPRILQQIAPVFPTYHLAQMMYATLGAPSQGSLAHHLAGLFGFAAVMMGVTWFAIQRREENA